jgi:hypothetical protein
MKNILKDKKLIFFLIFIPWGWLNFNILYFGHCHIDDNHEVVFHAHPFQKQNTHTSSFPDHVHSKNDLFLSAFIIKMIGLFIIFSMYVSFTLKKNKRTRLFLCFVSLQNLFYADSLKRGPPSNL